MAEKFGTQIKAKNNITKINNGSMETGVDESEFNKETIKEMVASLGLIMTTIFQLRDSIEKELASKLSSILERLLERLAHVEKGSPREVKIVGLVWDTLTNDVFDVVK